MYFIHDKYHIVSYNIQCSNTNICHSLIFWEKIGSTFYIRKTSQRLKKKLSSFDSPPKEKLINVKSKYKYETMDQSLRSNVSYDYGYFQRDIAMSPLKTGLPSISTHMCPGSRWSFFCRMKYKHTHVEEADTTTGNKCKKSKLTNYCLIHCNGYLKSWCTSKPNWLCVLT